MIVNYIYDEKGQLAYAVLPIRFWEYVQQQLPELERVAPPMPPKKIFNPLKYKGLIKSLNLNIEQELQNMRDEWTDHTFAVNYTNFH
jgi:hypothetical protein